MFFSIRKPLFHLQPSMDTTNSSIEIATQYMNAKVAIIYFSYKLFNNN